MAKAKAGLAVTKITQKAVELLGPVGYSKKLLVEKWMRDAKINDIYEGTQQINQTAFTGLLAERSLSSPRPSTPSASTTDSAPSPEVGPQGTRSGQGRFPRKQAEWPCRKKPFGSGGLDWPGGVGALYALGFPDRLTRIPNRRNNRPSRGGDDMARNGRNGSRSPPSRTPTSSTPASTRTRPVKEEQDKIFNKVWIIACHESEVPNSSTTAPSTTPPARRSSSCAART